MCDFDMMIEVQRAAELLRGRGLVAFPTETVYGLGANATCDDSVRRIYSAKGRPSFNPLIVHVATLEAACRFGTFSPTARVLADTFWPGPMTLIVPLKADSGISPIVSAGLSTLGLRVPSHPVAQALLRATDVPIAAPSANRSGHVSATSAAHVRHDFEDSVDLVLDGGTTDVGLESTIIDVSQDDVRLLRPGFVTQSDIEDVIKRKITLGAADSAQVTAPGQLQSHYAPKAAVRLNATDAGSDEVLIGFGSDAPDTALQLSAAGDLHEAARNLFQALRVADTSGTACIAVMPIPNEGVGIAINDRLRRAAAPR